jgi:cleavage and polyadenylation specificity factor subunit 5
MLLKLGSTFFKLPSGTLEDGESEADGLRRVLSNLFGKPSDDHDDNDDSKMETGDATGSNGPPYKSLEFPCVIREVVSNWWRPHFEPTQYPYLPSHVTAPKEHRRLMLVELPPTSCFYVPSNYQLLAAPLFELYDNNAGYGPVIASIPVAVSKFNLVFVEDEKKKKMASPTPME